MKHFYYSIAIVFLFVSCDINDMEMCYAMGPEITHESCVNDKCFFSHASLGFLANVDDQPCIQGVNSSAPFVYISKPVMPICYPRSTSMIDGYQKTKLYCKFFTKTSVFIFRAPVHDPPPPFSDGWFSCEERFYWCESTCGNGELEHWEQCDGDIYPNFMPLACSYYQELGDWLINFPSNGIIKCDQNCQLDFSECFRVN